MKRPKGPDLKMPQPKVPDFLVDLYWDLRDRHLLPLVVLGLVAIAAVPFLLGGDSERPAGPAAGAGKVVGIGASASRLTVVEAKPGLRDYHERLKGSPTDPFEQRYTSPQLAGTELGKGEEGESTATSTTKATDKTTTKTTTNADGTTTTEVTTTDESGGAGSGQVYLFSFAADIKITRTEIKEGGVKATEPPTVRHRVVPPSALPGDKEPLVTYMGISPKTRNALLLVSDAVSTIFGDAKCLSGKSTCQLLEIETGLPLTFVNASGSLRYKINVLKIQPVVSGKY